MVLLDGTMGSLSSNLLLAAFCLMVLDVVIFITCALYYVYKRYNSVKHPKAFEEKRTVVFGDHLMLSTQAVPVSFEKLDVAETYRQTQSRSYDQSPLSSTGSLSSPDFFDPSMYFLDSEDQANEIMKITTKLPNLQFSLHYERSLFELTVELILGRNFLIEKDDLESQSDILVSVILLPEGGIQHSTRGHPPNPMFNNKFSFFLHWEELRASKIKFNVWRIDKYSCKFPYGDFVVSLEEIFLNHALCARNIEMCKELELKENLMNETQKGEILLSLQHLPGAERLNICIMKGRDIKLEEYDKDIYVKVSAAKSDIRIKTKKTSLMKKTTTPLFNETTSFQLYPHSNLTLDDTSIIISMYATRSRGTHRRLVGRTVLGLDIANEAGKDHWKQMTDNPHKPIAVWQELH